MTDTPAPGPRICKDCDLDISDTHPTRERCNTHRRTHQLEYSRDRAKALRDAKVKKSPPPPKVVKTMKPCKRCKTTKKGRDSDHCAKCARIIHSQIHTIVPKRFVEGEGRRSD